MRRALPVIALSCVLLTSCGNDQPPAQGEVRAARGDTPPVWVEIVEPVSGATLSSPTVRVMLEAGGIEIVPAGEDRPGTGHHHLYLDQDVGEAGSVVPAGVPGIVHLGQGQSETELGDLSPGEHRLIAVLADGLHRILDPMATDTIRFRIGGG